MELTQIPNHMTTGPTRAGPHGSLPQHSGPRKTDQVEHHSTHCALYVVAFLIFLVMYVTREQSVPNRASMRATFAITDAKRNVMPDIHSTFSSPQTRTVQLIQPGATTFTNPSKGSLTLTPPQVSGETIWCGSPNSVIEAIISSSTKSSESMRSPSNVLSPKEGLSFLFLIWAVFAVCGNSVGGGEPRG